MAILKVPVIAEDHVQGSPNATVTLIEYGDYECPFCGLAFLMIKQLQKHFGEQLRFVFRNFPLTDIHPYAAISAEIAKFAAEHNKFWEMHDLLYGNQKSFTGPFLVELAKRLELSEVELEKAMKTHLYQPKIKSAFLGGVRSGVN
ncbi:putative Membrane protein [Chlamydiales bacterium STE3]|nr:putative Membrane protein [Chlamydiales bacterium STE3]